jgi:hypothetical protein
VEQNTKVSKVSNMIVVTRILGTEASAPRINQVLSCCNLSVGVAADSSADNWRYRGRTICVAYPVFGFKRPHTDAGVWYYRRLSMMARKHYDQYQGWLHFHWAAFCR